MNMHEYTNNYILPYTDAYEYIYISTYNNSNNNNNNFKNNNNK